MSKTDEHTLIENGDDFSNAWTETRLEDWI